MAAAAEQPGPAAVGLLREVVAGSAPNDAECLKVKEGALTKLTELLVEQRDAAALRSLLSDLRPLFAAIPKAKTAKIVRTVIDSIAKVPDSQQLLVSELGQGREGWAGQAAWWRDYRLWRGKPPSYRSWGCRLSVWEGSYYGRQGKVLVQLLQG